MDTLLVTIVSLFIVVIGLMIFSLVKLLNRIKLLHDNADKTSLENINIVNKTIKEFSENISRQQVLNQELIEKSISSIITLIDDKSTKVDKFMDETTEKLDSGNDKIKSLIVNELKSLNTNIVSIFDNLKVNSESLEKNILENTSNIGINVKNELELLDTKIIKTFKEVKNDTDEIKNISEKYKLNIKNQLENSFQNTVRLVNNLRLDNLINVSNEINKYRQGIYEDEHFLQEVGYCKIIKVTDKENGDITNVYYDENGEKSYTETFNDNILRYSMQYENNKLKVGTEFNSNGEISFEYIYDNMEEINKKIEYIYDSNLKLQEKIETNF